MSTPKDNFETSGLDRLIEQKSDTFKCDFEGCNKEFIQKYRLKIHMRSHQGIKPFKCSECSKTFLEKANLKVHIRTHTGERPYYCDFENCEASFKTSGQLNDHKNHHYNIRKNLCIKCGKSFTRKSSLKTHMLIHEEVFPYKCEYENCDRTFREKGNMKKHLKTHFDTMNINNHNEHENLNSNNMNFYKFQNVENSLHNSNTLNFNYESLFFNERLSKPEPSDQVLKKNLEVPEEKMDENFFYLNSQNEYYSNLNDYQ
jgi:uncharacterized Zn-finger protein